MTLESFYDYEVQDASGKALALDQYRGKAALVVNTASRCGFVGQFKGLEEVYQRYKDRGFTVFCFPSNDYMAQEPKSDSEILEFCQLSYDASFPILAKGSVRGADKQAVYRYLTERSAPDFCGDPGWNFVKFLIDPAGQVVGRFSALTKPTSSKLTKEIERVLPG